MSFLDTYNRLPDSKSMLLRKFEALLVAAAPEVLERMAQESMQVTRRHFGRTMRLFAPIYVSNECVNNCAYCGFSRDNPILRVTLTVDQVVAELRAAGSRTRPDSDCSALCDQSRIRRLARDGRSGK